jgi:hypothetical protein
VKQESGLGRIVRRPIDRVLAVTTVGLRMLGHVTLHEPQLLYRVLRQCCKLCTCAAGL